MSTKQAVAEAIYMLLKGADLSRIDAYEAVNMGLSDYSLSLGHGPTYNPEHEAMSNDPSFCPDVELTPVLDKVWWQAYSEAEFLYQSENGVLLTDNEAEAVVYSRRHGVGYMTFKRPEGGDHA